MTARDEGFLVIHPPEEPKAAEPVPLVIIEEVPGWVKRDEQGRPIALTIEIVGEGRFLVPLVMDGDA